MKYLHFVNGVKMDERTLFESHQQNIERMRMYAGEAILQAGLDTATQQNAALGIYSPERCEAIKNYIAACRNEYLRCKGLILAATSNEAADSVQFQPPSVPENL
jgi:hypothetical protein